MSADAKVPYQNPSQIDSNLGAQQYTDDNGNTVLQEIVSMAAHGLTSGGPVQSTTPNTPVRLSISSVPCKHVSIQALGPDHTGTGGNNGFVWIGGIGVSAANKVGICLPPGSTYELDINDVNKVYFDVEVSGDKVTFNSTL